MTALPPPPVLPDPAWSETKRLGRNHWVRVGTCDYSMHHRPSGGGWRCVWTSMRSWSPAPATSWSATHDPGPRTVTDVDHEQARTVMRAFAAPLADDHEVEVRDLSTCDRATGVA